MKKKLRYSLILCYITFIYTTLFLLYSCTYPPQGLEGKWERFGDESKATQLEVTCKNDTCRGILLKIEGGLEEAGFVKGDIKWDKITKINDKEYEGNDLLQLVNTNGEVEKKQYLPMKILFVSDDILYMHSEAETETNEGDITDAGYKKEKKPEQKWKRIR